MSIHRAVIAEEKFVYTLEWPHPVHDASQPAGPLFVGYNTLAGVGNLRIEYFAGIDLIGCADIPGPDNTR